MEEPAGLEVIRKYFSDFTETQWQQFAMLGDLYKDWNQKINVISRKDIDQLYEKHVLHSLAIAAVCSFKPGARVLDMGTGGGFPGIPLAIFFPEVSFTLVDSIGKKIKVVEEVSAALGLKNVTAINGRAENLKGGKKFHFAMSRAVAPLKDLWYWARPLLLTGRESEEFANGLISLKGGDLNQEISDSALRPRVTSIQEIFPETYFEEKWLLWVGR